jgi:hypothetical protein
VRVNVKIHLIHLHYATLPYATRLLEKGSECFESLSMNGKSSIISKVLRSFLRQAQDGL